MNVEVKNNSGEEPEKKPKEKKKFKCKVCDAQFDTSTQRDKHLFYYEGFERPKCGFCNKIFDTYSGYAQHVKIHDANAPTCNICDARFSSLRLLTMHKSQHSDSRPFDCPTCGKSYKTEVAVRKHAVVHTHTEKNLECEICGKRFNLKRQLRVHRKIHLDPMKVECDICGNKVKKISLKQHMLIHSLPTVKCEICDKQLNKSKLKNHMSSHVAKDKKECYICKKLVNSHYLSDHIKVVHKDNKIYNCDMCNKSFSRSDYLTRHKTVHMEIKPFPCNMCTQTFSRAQYLNSHIEKIHTNPKRKECKPPQDNRKRKNAICDDTDTTSSESESLDLEFNSEDISVEIEESESLYQISDEEDLQDKYEE